MKIKHFGVELKKKDAGDYLTRNNYTPINKKPSFKHIKEPYSDKWCEQHEKKCLTNFDLNMRYLSDLKSEEFNESLDNFLGETNNKFKEIFDLNSVANKKGYYLLVLGEYKQVYIGNSKDIKKRTRAHWSKTKEFDRLIFGSIEDSKLSIDSFRALDTTRIFVYLTNEIYTEENLFINMFDSRFLINRTSGGIQDRGLEDAILNRKTRPLNESQSINQDEKDLYARKLRENAYLRYKREKENVIEIDFKKVTVSTSNTNNDVIVHNGKRYVSYEFLNKNNGINYSTAKALIGKYNINVIKKRKHFVDESEIINAHEDQNHKTEISVSIIVIIIFVAFVLLLLLAI